MKNEKLMRAMSEIDEDLILEARAPRKVKVKWARWSALAACLAFLMVVTPVCLFMINGGASMEADAVFQPSGKDEANSSLPEKVPAEGIYDASLDGKLEYSDIIQSIDGEENEKPSDYRYSVGETVTEKGQSIDFRAANESSFSFYVKKSTDEPLLVLVQITDAEGKIQITASPDEISYLSLTVNGEPCEDLPDKAGRYDIKLALTEPDLRISFVMINHSIFVGED